MVSGDKCCMRDCQRVEHRSRPNTKLKNKLPDLSEATLGQLGVATALGNKYCDRCREGLQHIIKILGDTTDDQNVPVCQEVLMNEELRRCLQAAGYESTSEALTVMGAGHQAFNMPGLTTDNRTARLEELRTFLVRAFGGAYHSVKALTSSDKVGGLPKVLVCALLSNIDGRLCLIARYPGLDGWLNEYKGLGTDDVELAFSALAKRAGWKAPAMQQLRLLRSIRALRRLKTDPNSGITVQHSQHRKYGPERHHADIVASWNDGSAIGVGSLCEARYMRGIEKAAKRCVRDKTSIRNYRKGKMY